MRGTRLGLVALAVLTAGCAAPAEPPATLPMEQLGMPNSDTYASRWAGREAEVGVVHLRIAARGAVEAEAREPLRPVASFDPANRTAAAAAPPEGLEAAVFVEIVDAASGAATWSVAYVTRGSTEVLFLEEHLVLVPQPGTLRLDILSPTAKRTTLPGGKVHEARLLSTNLAPGEALAIAYPDHPASLAVDLRYHGPWPKANLTAAPDPSPP